MKVTFKGGKMGGLKFWGILLTFISLSAWAGNEFSFGPVQFYGKGCPANHTQVVMTPDQKAISILFDSFSAEVPQFDGDNDNQNFWVNRKQIMSSDQRYKYLTCSMWIDAFIPAGEQVDGVVIDVDWRGAANLDRGSEASITASLMQWLGLRTRSAKVETIASKQWSAATNAVDDNYYLQASREIPLPHLCAGPSDRKISFKLANILMAHIFPNVATNASFALLSLDSNDVVGKLKLKIKTSPCAKK